MPQIDLGIAIIQAHTLKVDPLGSFWEVLVLGAFAFLFLNPKPLVRLTGFRVQHKRCRFLARQVEAWFSRV